MMAIVNSLNTNISEEKNAVVRREEDMSLADLNTLYNKHVSHLQFMKENNLLTDFRKKNIIKNIEDVYELITNSHSNKKRSRDDQTEVDNHNTNSNSQVS